MKYGILHDFRASTTQFKEKSSDHFKDKLLIIYEAPDKF